jgi:hypothetical protein
MPVHPTNVEPFAAVADKVTMVPLLYIAVQLLPQLIPAGELATVPLPVPALDTERPKVCSANMAVQDAAAVIVNEPVLHPAPLQPAKIEPDAAVGVRVTVVPLVKDDEQTVPQLMPAGELVTVPVPVPVLITERP